jgi:hypothetical protein
MNTPIRTRRAVIARAEVIARFGLAKDTSFVDAARELIARDHLYAEVPVDRSGACRFLHAYHVVSQHRPVKPLPEYAWGRK